MRSHWRSWLSLSSPETLSSSAFRQGATSATQAANAFWLTLTNSSAIFGFFSSQAPLTTSELPYGLSPMSFQLT